MGIKPYEQTIVQNSIVSKILPFKRGFSDEIPLRLNSFPTDQLIHHLSAQPAFLICMKYDSYLISGTFLRKVYLFYLCKLFT